MSRNRAFGAYDDLSQASLRFGQPVFFSAYSLAAASISGRTKSRIGAMPSVFFTQALPFHCRMFILFAPEWSAQLSFMVEPKPASPIAIDVVPGRGAGFTLEAPEGVRFLTRSRVFTDAEVAELDAAGPPQRAA
jgi:hypothetical protein